MKSTRRWFYLTGSLTVLVLALMGVLWAMSVAAAPPGATELTKGDVSTDLAVVGPTIDDADDRTIEVTLTNAALSKVLYVGTGPDNEDSDFDLNGDDDKDDDDIVLVTIGGTGVDDGDTFRVRLSDGDRVGSDSEYTLSDIPAEGDRDSILPIVDRNGDGSLTIADVEIVDLGDEPKEVGPKDVEVVRILDAATGLLQFEAEETLDADDVFGLRFATSPQETALVNVRGDNGDFDLLTVEDEAGLSGEYSAKFVAADKIIVNIGDGIMHEQHDVPRGLRGNVEINDERIRLTEDVAADGRFTITVNNPPIRPEESTEVGVVEVPAGDIDIDTSGVTLENPNAPISAENARLGMLDLTTTRELKVGDEIEVSYRGSDTFEIELDYAPVQTDLVAEEATENNNFVVPSNDSGLAMFDDYFAVVDQDQTTGKVKIGVIVGFGDDNEDLNKALPAHITVLGVTYGGSETVTIPNSIATSSGENVRTGDFTVELDFEIQDTDGVEGITADDITIVAGGENGEIIAGNRLEVVAATGDSREVTFGFGSNADVTTEEAEGARRMTFTVAYAHRVGLNAINALRPGDDPRPIIQVDKGSRITITSDDDRTQVDAEADPPTFDNATPGHGSATNDLKQVISIDVTDALAGVDTDTIQFLVTTNMDAAPGDITNVFGNDKGERITLTMNGDVVTASVGLDDLEDDTSLSIDDDGVTTIYWFVEATDKADNQGTSDSDGDTDGKQGFSLRVDNQAPKMTGAFVGDRWDANYNIDDDDDKGTVRGDRRLKGDQYLEPGSNSKMVRVEFDEALDGSSVDASDFEVMDGAAELEIVSASWYNANNDDDRENLDVPIVKNSVFIELEEALGAGDTPSVKLTGTVTDAAGNEVSDATIDADDVVDGIAPTAMVSLDTMTSKQKVAVTVRTDERIRTLEPTLQLYTSSTSDPDTAEAKEVGFTIPRSSRTAGQNEWTFNLSISQAGRYSVVVTVEDASRNKSSAGKQTWASSGAISFEIDDDLPRPMTGEGDDARLDTNPMPGGEASLSDQRFFIEVNWLTEDAEYTGDSQKNVSLTKAVLDAGKDNERDVLDLASTRDGRRWTIAVDNIDLGKHTLTFNGEDSLGNTLDDDEVLDFTVAARPVFNVDLSPGLNLVSLPGDPTDKGINAVFGDHGAVDLVYTRSGDLWLVAQRSAETGMFEPTGGVSDLTSVDAQHAYFVRATASVRVGVDISSRGALQVPPSIQVKGNQWNLVPVISLLPLDSIMMGSALDADTYLGADWTRGFTFDRGRWMGVVPNAEGDDATHQCHNPAVSTADRAVQGYETGTCGTEDPNNIGQYYTEDAGGKADVVEIGRGYWVWFTKDSTITP